MLLRLLRVALAMLMGAIVLLQVLLLMLMLGGLLHVLLDKSVGFSSERHYLALEHFTVVFDQVAFGCS